MKIRVFFIFLIFILPVLIFAEDSRLAKLRDRSESIISRQVVAKMMINDRVPEVGPALAEILKNTKEDDTMRLFAMKSLGELKNRMSGPTLQETKQLYALMGDGILMRDKPGNKLSKAYLDIIGAGIFKNDPEVLIAAGQFMSKSIDLDLKYKAIDLLSASSSKEPLTLLMIALSDKDPAVRKKVIVAVAKLAKGDAVTLFISKLEEETDDDVRALYAEELNKLPIPIIRKSWIGDLTFWVAEETRKDIKKDLASALEKIKAANQGADPYGTNISLPKYSRPAVKAVKK